MLVMSAPRSLVSKIPDYPAGAVDWLGGRWIAYRATRRSAWFLASAASALAAVLAAIDAVGDDGGGADDGCGAGHRSSDDSGSSNSSRS